MRKQVSLKSFLIFMNVYPNWIRFTVLPMSITPSASVVFHNLIPLQWVESDHPKWPIWFEIVSGISSRRRVHSQQYQESSPSSTCRLRSQHICKFIHVHTLAILSIKLWYVICLIHQNPVLAEIRCLKPGTLAYVYSIRIVFGQELCPWISPFNSKFPKHNFNRLINNKDVW